MSNKNTAARLATFALAVGLSSAALAQAMAGGIFGDAKPGDVVVIANPAKGFTKELTVNETGRFKLHNLPIGEYVVTVKHADGTAEQHNNIKISVGTNARVM